MNIEIKNLGPISKFNFDLEKDLHVIYGKNSIGKSYAIYCIYIFLKKFTEITTRSIYLFYDSGSIESRNIIKQFSNAVKHKAENNRGENITIQKEFESVLAFYFDSIISNYITESFRNTFFSLADLKNSFSKKKPEIKIITENFSLLFVLDKSNKFTIKEIKCHEKIEVYQGKRAKKFNIVINGEQIFKGVVEPNDLNTIINWYARKVIDGIRKSVNQIYFLPSSRSGLYLALSSFSPIIAELSKFRFQLKRKIELPSISEPISDYFIPLANINSKRVSKSLAPLVQKIEKEILQGTINIDNENKRILFQPDNTDLKLDLSVTSSMVSEIAPIVTYLKHIITNDSNRIIENSLFGEHERRIVREGSTKNIIFIEEPEAHLHPDIQIKLMEIFAELTKHKIKVVITSHSNYMFNKLVNLIIAKKIDFNDVSISHMKMTDLGSIVSDDMQPTFEGVEDFNFSEPSENLYEERIKILEESNLAND